ncbi:hypothetical protein J6590_070623 [Homalodisca vitripennis]|nr:hypothetical protein J6590_070623 [Homalodisca vitripennis]
MSLHIARVTVLSCTLKLISQSEAAMLDERSCLNLSVRQRGVCDSCDVSPYRPVLLSLVVTLKLISQSEAARCWMRDHLRCLSISPRVTVLSCNSEVDQSVRSGAMLDERSCLNLSVRQRGVCDSCDVSPYRPVLLSLVVTLKLISQSEAARCWMRDHV